jgi:hypothetical protein
VAFVVLAIELLAGFGLLIGRLTRVSAFAVLCDALAVIVMITMQHRGLEMLQALESAALLGAASFYFLTAGSGVFSADTALRRRAQLKALRDDEIWQRPPYVASETYVGADGVVYEDPDSFVEEPAAEIVNRRNDVRRRFFVRHSGSRE